MRIARRGNKKGIGLSTTPPSLSDSKFEKKKYSRINFEKITVIKISLLDLEDDKINGVTFLFISQISNSSSPMRAFSSLGHIT